MTENRLRHTRIKICGLTQQEDVNAAVQAGADAVGFVLYAKSPRSVSIEHAKELIRHLPPFITPVLLFVNAQKHEVREAIKMMPQAILQFHGDEKPLWCEQFARPYIKAARVQENTNLIEYQKSYHHAQALLLDAFSEHYGGSGRKFNWSLIPKDIAHRVVLAGGLNAANVGQAIDEVQPWAVDVSSGVEASAGIKDAHAMIQFVQAVRAADACLIK